jgi:hypothetical protein
LELPSEFRTPKWGILIASYLSLDIWLNKKISGTSSDGIFFQGRVRNSLSSSPSSLLVLGRQSGCLNQKIPDTILHPVVKGLEDHEANLSLTNIQEILQSFVTVPPSFANWILYNERSM